MIKYRAEIDGLRALAVLPVVLFHAGFEIFKGGFVGVDVFFVISGYLITSIILSEMEVGSFSITKFYERRARRILPALFAVMLICMPFAWFWMLPEQLKSFSQALVAVSIFSSNILFWRDVNYFAESSELHPLLHTWSLAVEEQFYIFFPLLLLILWPFGKKKIFLTFIIIAFISLLVSEWGWRNSPVANFYLAPSRAWELMFGAIAAIYIEKTGPIKNNFLSLLGFFMILYSVFLFDEKTPFPSVYTLVPVIGTFLLIVFGSAKTIISRILMQKQIVFLGLISYSLYLWHQPIFAFAKIRLLESDEYLRSILIIFSVIMGWFSWKFIEQPFRSNKKHSSFTRQQIFSLSGIFIVIFITLGLIGHFNNGFKEREYNSINFSIIEQKLQPSVGFGLECTRDFQELSICSTSDKPTVVVWGDSYAAHLIPGILASSNNILLRQHTKNACSPLLDVSWFGDKRTTNWGKECIEFNDSVFSWIKNNESIELVVISSPFDYIEKYNFIDKSGAQSQATVKKTAYYLKKTIDRISDIGKSVVIVSPPPKEKNKSNIGDCLKHQNIFNNDIECNFPLILDTAPYKMLRLLEKDHNIYWLYEDICQENICNASIDGVFIYRDSGHLAIEGSKYLGKKNNWVTKFSNEN